MHDCKLLKPKMFNYFFGDSAFQCFHKRSINGQFWGVTQAYELPVSFKGG